MNNYNYKILAMATVLSLAFSSCKKDLDLTPTNDITADKAYADFSGYQSGVAKVYGSYATPSNIGTGTSDVSGQDPGFADFLRGYWNLQELPTDEAACAWIGDAGGGIQGLDYNSYVPSNVLILGMYARSMYQISVVNEFLRESTDAKVASRGITGNDAQEIKYFAAEARFIRAFQYWVLMDFFGNPPFITEENKVGKESPQQITRAKLFEYVESELLAIEPLLKETNEYGRVTKAADWALLARLYLNAGVYTGTNKYNEAAQYAGKVISSGHYSLHPVYANLFKGDNDKNNPEVILSINYDGVKTQNYGGTTYLINAAVNGDMGPVGFGIPNGGWGGNRSRPNLPNLFGDYKNTKDKRAMFWGDNPNITDISIFKQGLAVTKFTNLTSTGTTPPSVGGTYCSTDFPLFRLAEMYLVYAEAVARGGSGSTATALGYLNLLRQRAYGDASGNLSSYTVDDILNERGRELYWEGFRRTDLIRYSKYTSDTYLWPFKGGIAAGKGLEAYKTLYPLPVSDVIANTNLTQNPGY
ncbi:RagB/SusD family nutrient uptake outer membrane protein [Pararcticibacter amylolyticus]|uniref:RagB/SusD family nutrient uptake outer membrane protein n=1 Tax=Pararcticibacter amylolyticus TaxID=2173175 RepID=A0A2U2PFT0_9SPHI|nr:RagB/SusD family nutrient uptake outer membrane protein [Pararcticibacter amylolyticus]PWG80233.1 RagB/SusD family nutrient uptake outer membrane protein [Pararcticibacter amylolyticus]